MAGTCYGTLFWLAASCSMLANPAIAAQCKFNGQWYDYNSPQCANPTSSSGRQQPAPASPSLASAWYDGGTLHSASIEGWMAADYSNRLATSADFIVSISKKENPQLLDASGPGFLVQLKFHASELEKCISKVGAEPNASRGFSAAELGAMCYITMYKSGR